MGTWSLTTRGRQGKVAVLAAILLALALLAAGLFVGPVDEAQAGPSNPVVSSVSPTSGPLAGGNAVVIKGSNFTNVKYVKFGSTNASFTVNSSAQITATAPARSWVRTVDVRVTTNRGTSKNTSADNYSYLARPRVILVAPSSGPATGGTKVTILGTGFTTGSTVSFGSTPATTQRVYSSLLMTATAPAGTGVVDVTVTNPGGTSANGLLDRFLYTKVTPRVTTWPTASPIKLGEPLSASTLTGGTASVPGTFAFTTPGLIPGALGPYSAAVTFTPTDTAAYSTVTRTVTVPVNPAGVDLSTATIDAIPDQTFTGAALEPAVTVTLGATTLVAGTDYTVACADNTNVGTATVTITGTGSYTGTASATFQIVKATPEVTTWPTASAIDLGQALSASTLTGGTVSAPGTFAFTDPSIVPDAVGTYSASVTFTPTDPANYNTVTGTVDVTVNPVTIDIADATIEAIPDQTYTGAGIEPALSVTVGSTTLVAGTDYSVAYADNTNVGTATVTLTGLGAYTGTKSASFQIVKGTPTITTWPTASGIARGQELLASTLTGGAASVPGSFAFTDPTTKPTLAGTYAAAVTFTPTDPANYNTVTGSVNVAVAENNAVAQFVLKFTDKAGTAQTLGSWDYDRAALTFKDGDGTEAPFVKSFDPYLRYSGRDSLCSRLAVVTKGILLTDLASYAANATGIPVDGTATTTGWGAISPATISNLDNRYYYPSYAMFGSYPPNPPVAGEFDEATRVKVPAVLSILAYGNRNLAGSGNAGWAANPYLTALNGGVEVAVPTDQASLDNAFNVLARAADDDRSLRSYMGQAENDAYTANLGRYSIYNNSIITLTPVYFDITTNVTSTDGLGAASVTTDDTYLKAAATESVSFSISDITAGHKTGTVSVTDGSGGMVGVTETSGTYTFTMPSSVATVNVALEPDVTTHTVTFVSDGATYTTVSAVHNATIDAPTEPTKTGFGFGGWCSDEALTTVVSFPYTVTADVTLYAKWVANCTVTFMSDGATYTTVSAAPGATIDAPANPTKSGYLFTCWCSDEALTTEVIFPYTVTGDRTLYAKWLQSDLTYTLSGTTATVSDYVGTAGGSVVIPETITVGGKIYTVTAIGYGAFAPMDGNGQNPKYRITSVSIPDSVTSIGDYAFAYLARLTSLKLPDGLTTIGQAAFMECRGLTSVDIPSSVASVGEAAFGGCRLTSAYFEGSMPTFGNEWGGLTFSDWYDGTICTVYYPVSQAASWASYPMTEPLVAYCGLTLDLQDGSTPAGSRVNVDGSGHIAAPADPARAGYAFAGWYKEAACTNVFDFATETVTGDLTLYAKWVFPTPVTGVTLDKETDTITAGSTDQLTATVAPDDATNPAVTWSSSNESVATVDSTGLVTAVAAGEATITVATVDGSFTDTCAVTVNAATTDIAGAAIAPIPDQTYTGSALTPDAVVTLGAATLVKDTDYSVAYADNVSVGTATVTLTGLGSYTGTKSASFQIVKGTPEVTTWPAASALTLGEALSASTLTGGTASVPGAFAFTDPSIIPTAVGTYVASVTFTPTDTANYATVTGTVDVTVNAAGPHVWDGTSNTTWYTEAPAGTTVFNIYTAEELAGLASLVNGGNTFAGLTVNLMADIYLNDHLSSGEDATARAWVPISSGGGTSFQGTFDGQGHLIKNLYYYDTAGAPVGLFGGVDNGTVIRNMGLTGYIRGFRYVGGIAGIMGTYGSGSAPVIENCVNYATIIGDASGTRGVGGLVGNARGSIRNCYNMGSVTDLYRPAGGIAGLLDDGTIENCYNTGTVVSAAGGTYQGAIVATRNLATSIVKDCYWLDTSCTYGAPYGSGTVTNVVSKTETEMKAPEFLTLLNAHGIMFFADSGSINNGYPVLFWQSGAGSGPVGVTVGTPEHGTVSCEPTTGLSYGTKITLHSTPDANYTLSYYTVDGQQITGDYYYVTSEIVVSAVFVPANVPVTGVTLEPETATLDPGGTDQLTATVAPDDATNPAVTWSSSNESVATVDASGLVTALAGGSATITVTTTDGGFTDTCLVTVSVPFVPPVLSSLDAETVTTTTGGNTIPGPTYQAGPTLGGNQVILTGTGFTGATQVYFGTTAATSFTVDSDTQITAVAPAGTEGTVEVSVLGSDGTTVSNTVPYRYALWQISGVVRGRWVTELDEDLNPVLNPESGGALAGAFVYVTINALDPLYDAVNLDNNKVTFFDGTTWVDRAVTAADGTYTFSTASFRGKPLPIGTIVDVVALHDLSTYTSGFYAPDPDEWHNNKSVLQYGIYDRPNTLVNFRNYTSTLGPDGLTLGNRVLPWDDGGIPAMPNEFLTPNVFTDIS